MMIESTMGYKLHQIYSLGLENVGRDEKLLLNLLLTRRLNERYIWNFGS